MLEAGFGRFMHIRITRRIRIPDPIKLARYARSPELGPKILFFSGGNALRKLSRKIIEYTYNTISIVTPFDSGGSSAELRKAFKMPAIGDVRNRLMALADQSLLGNPEIFSLFAYRFPRDRGNDELRGEFDRMLRGKHPLVADIIDPMRKIIRRHLLVFQQNMPPDFDLRGASVGNLVLTAGYLENQRHLDPVIYIFSKLVQVRGTVRPVTNRNLHLAAELENGEVLVGQHLITGKDAPPIRSKIERVFLSENPAVPSPAEISIRSKVKKLIDNAELICYPMGSFYSSVIANLLPESVGSSIAANNSPKVYVPNTGHDPESFGLNVSQQVETLLDYLKRNGTGEHNRDVLNFVILDTKNGNYRGEPDIDRIRNMGIEIIDCPLITRRSDPYIDENLLVPVLLTLT